MPNTLCACQELRVGRLEERIGDSSLIEGSVSAFMAASYFQ
jgi:hypothetical protein